MILFGLMILIPVAIWAFMVWDNADADYAKKKARMELQSLISENNFKESN